MDNKSSLQIDEKIVIESSKDRMLAVAYFEPPKNGGSSLTSEQIHEAIRKAGIKYGIKDETVNQIIYSRQYHYKYVIASGEKPIDGEDARIELQFDKDKLYSNKPKEKEDGTVDFKNLDMVYNVRQSDLLAVKIPAKDGVDGRNVLGQVVKAKKGKDVRLPQGKNTHASNTGLELLASIDGQLEYDEYNIFISPVYTVKGNLDASVGNIDFLGSVVVNGNVLSGFTIKAQGNVEVRGSVEDAVIIAEGNIVLAYGIQGMGNARLEAGGDIIAKFVQNSTLQAGGEVIAEAIIHSKVQAGNAIKVDMGKGSIVGGEAAAVNLISAKTIGSVMGAPTSIQIGISGESYDQYKELAKSYESKKQEVKKINQAIEFLVEKSKQEYLPNDKIAMLKKLMDNRPKVEEELNKLKEEYARLAQLVRDVNSGMIKVRDTLYCGTKITIGNIIKYIDENYNYCMVQKLDGDIHISPY